MRSNDNTNKKELVLNTVMVILVFIIAAGVIISMVNSFIINCKYEKTQTKISELQGDIQNLELTSGEDKIKASEYEEIINYLESETTKHREFIETQRQFLIWLIAAIGAVAIVILGFVGLSNKKEIEDTVNRTVDNFSKEAFENKLGLILRRDMEYDDERIGYLIDAVEKQRKISETNIVFFKQENQSLKVLHDCAQNLKKQCRVFEYPVKVIANAEDNLDITEFLPDGKSIVVYEVNRNEYRKEEKLKYNNPQETKEGKEAQGNQNANKKYEYNRVSDSCNEHDIYCILYTGKGEIDSISNTYTAMSNSGVSLYQYLNTLINL